MYVELDASLEPRAIKDINDISGELDIEGFSSKEFHNISIRGFSVKDFESKYEVKTGKALDFLLQSEGDKVAGNRDTILNKRQEEKWNTEADMWMYEELDKAKERIAKEFPIPDLEAVLGTSKEMCYDQDWGFFSTILTCYNNHWILKTTPDDWWNVIVKNISQAVDDHGDKQKVRDFFVSYEGQKKIHITVPSLINLDYEWLFDIFSVEVRKNIKTPGYVELMEADFTTTTPEKTISTQIMLMSSLQKYFQFSLGTSCGIPGVEMMGTEKDWEKLVDKTEELEKTLNPILEVLELTSWFKKTKDILSNLLNTYRNKRETLYWWQHILTWNVSNGSGETSFWNGWIIDFLMAGNGGKAETPLSFKSGVVSLPVTISDCLQGPVVEDTGHLVAGTFGFTIHEGEHGKTPSVGAVQGWALLMPKGSEVTPRLRAMPWKPTSEFKPQQSLVIRPKAEIDEAIEKKEAAAEVKRIKDAEEAKRIKEAERKAQEAKWDAERELWHQQHFSHRRNQYDPREMWGKFRNKKGPTPSDFEDLPDSQQREEEGVRSCGQEQGGKEKDHQVLEEKKGKKSSGNKQKDETKETNKEKKGCKKESNRN